MKYDVIMRSDIESRSHICTEVLTAGHYDKEMSTLHRQSVSAFTITNDDRRISLADFKYIGKT